jgi:hypothetical protein
VGITLCISGVFMRIFIAHWAGNKLLIFLDFYEGTVRASARPDPRPPVLALMVRGPSACKCSRYMVPCACT